MPKSKPKAVKSRVSSSLSGKARTVKKAHYKTFRISRKIKQPQKPLKSSFKIFKLTIRHLWAEKKLFGGILAVYLLASFVLVGGLSNLGDVNELKAVFRDSFQGSSAEFAASIALFGTLIGNAGSPVSEAAGIYQSLLFIVFSLALIWASRQTIGSSEQSPKIRDAFYKSMYPAIPFILVLAVIGLQLVPLAIGSFMYSIVTNGQIATATAESFAIWILLGLLALLSLYMLSSSIFALYIVTLPNVAPMQALKSAREVVANRRWLVMRKVLFLPLVVLIYTALLIVPLIIVAPVVATWTFVVLSLFSIAVSHSYLYHLYRELLK